MGVLRVSEAFSTDVDGVPRVYPAGTLIDSKDPVAKGRERFFAKVEDYVARSNASNAGATETATAAPGERRSRREAKKAARAAQKIAEEANRTGADDGEADPESGSNQVPGVNRTDGSDDGDTQTAEQKRSEKAVQKVAEEVNPTGADDGQKDPESASSQVPGVNRKGQAAPTVAKKTAAQKRSSAAVQKAAEEANPTGADDGEKDPESGSNQVEGVNRKGGSGSGGTK